MRGDLGGSTTTYTIAISIAWLDTVLSVLSNAAFFTMLSYVKQLLFFWNMPTASLTWPFFTLFRGSISKIRF